MRVVSGMYNLPLTKLHYVIKYNCSNLQIGWLLPVLAVLNNYNDYTNFLYHDDIWLLKFYKTETTPIQLKKTVTKSLSYNRTCWPIIRDRRPLYAEMDPTLY